MASPATEQVGSVMLVRPAFWASPLMMAGVMSGVPTMASRLMLSRTSDLPLRLTIEQPSPKAMRMTLATRPPYLVKDFMAGSLLLGLVLLLAPFQRRRGPGGSGLDRPVAAARNGSSAAGSYARSRENPSFL